MTEQAELTRELLALTRDLADAELHPAADAERAGVFPRAGFRVLGGVLGTYCLSEPQSGSDAAAAERYLREAKVLQIVEGTNQIQRMVIGRSLATG